jgi:hypothetical protein
MEWAQLCYALLILVFGAAVFCGHWREPEN